MSRGGIGRGSEPREARASPTPTRGNPMSLFDSDAIAWAVVGAAGVVLGLAALLVALVRRRRGRLALYSGVAVLAAAALLGWQLYRLDQGLDAELRQSDALLAGLGEEIALTASASEARTDSGR